MTWTDVQTAIANQGQASGLTQAQVQVAQVIAYIEGGTGNGYGDYVNGQPTSFGPFQFHLGGALNGFAAWLGLPLTDRSGQVNPAVVDAARDPTLSAQYALQQGGYLFNAIAGGTKTGLSGIALATYAEITGERPAGNYTSVWLTITNAWQTLWPGLLVKPPAPVVVQPGTSPIPAKTFPNPNPSVGGTTGPVIPPKTFPTPTAPGNCFADAFSPPNFVMPDPPTSALDIAGIASYPAKAALAVLMGVLKLAECLFWIIFGLVLIIVGLFFALRQQ